MTERIHVRQEGQKTDGTAKTLCGQTVVRSFTVSGPISLSTAYRSKFCLDCLEKLIQEVDGQAEYYHWLCEALTAIREATANEQS